MSHFESSKYALSHAADSNHKVCDAPQHFHPVRSGFNQKRGAPRPVILQQLQLMISFSALYQRTVLCKAVSSSGAVLKDNRTPYTVQTLKKPLIYGVLVELFYMVNRLCKLLHGLPRKYCSSLSDIINCKNLSGKLSRSLGHDSSTETPFYSPVISGGPHTVTPRCHLTVRALLLVLLVLLRAMNMTD